MANPRSQGLSIVVPAYNEEASILATIDGLFAIMAPSEIDFEIIVVNDHSTDMTAELLNEYCRNYSGHNLIVINHNRNKGYGASLKSGILKACFPTIAITDADMTYPNEKIPEMYAEYHNGEYHMVIGRRSFKQLPTATKPAKWFITKLASYLVDEKIEDLNSGLRVFQKDAIIKSFHIISDGFSFTTTSHLMMLNNNGNIKYIPIEYSKRHGKSKIRPIRDTLNFIQIIIMTTMYFNPLKVFIPLSLCLAFLSVLVLVTGVLFLDTLFDSTIAILLIGSLQTISIGMIADLITKRNSDILECKIESTTDKSSAI